MEAADRRRVEAAATGHELQEGGAWRQPTGGAWRQRPPARGGSGRRRVKADPLAGVSPAGELQGSDCLFIFLFWT
jgi:hypothetical protein